MIKKTSLVKISVLMSLFSEPENWLNEAIDSILNQTFTDFEFIIINDNPERELNHLILREYQSKDKRIVIINNEVNVGLTKSLNIGLKIAKGKYIARMDADDISLTNRLEEQVKFMDLNPHLVASGTSIEYFGKEKINKKKLILPCDENTIRNHFVIQNPNFPPVAHPTAIIRSSVLHDNSILYNENYVTAQDFGLWNELLEYGDISNLNMILLRYRLSDNQITAKKNDDQILTVKKINRKHIKHYFFKNKIDCIVPLIITLHDIIELKRLRKTSNNKNLEAKFDGLIFCYYLSLDVYDFKLLIFYLKSLDFINIKIPLKERLKIFIKIFNKNKYFNYL
jgi:glycosyltransferase involved in cell wall biosynthesis